MAEDDDLRAILPDPPRPAPARREAAIEEAMARFDGHRAPTRAPSHQPAPSWAWVRRPQAGLLAAAALVAVISLPYAWTQLVPIVPSGEVQSEAAAPGDPPPAQSDAADPPSMAATPDAAEAEASGPRPPKPGRALAEMAAPTADMVAPPAMPPPPPAPVAAPPPPVGFDKPSEALLAFTQPSIARNGEKAEAAAVQGRSDTLEARNEATGQPPASMRQAYVGSTEAKDSPTMRATPAVPAGRGDWNACTIADPSQNPGFCQTLAMQAPRTVRDKAKAALGLGLQQAWQGNVSEAIAAFDRAIAAAPNVAIAYLNRGLAYDRLGQRRRALADLDRAVTRAPRSAQAYYHRAVLLRKYGETRRAAIDEAQAVRLDERYGSVIP